ncbi:adenosylcobalamin-dependent ribonucleoside-diphosphate reductase [candidate division WOR-3 bacterium]|uniref:Vitamin B12-dependent ribonucleotide reductase n=1 Tax=candidate division WOR-3 bacterium TaxID=2052148 RepID=A0A660SHJ2_UNCW3|nr:MAG: adenosylcobalamin-dependent ribonucleoside-diphosphate reductase [candidate division WOR-3 bacterium]
MISQVVKRDGEIVPFQSEKINHAIARALLASGRKKEEADQLTAEVVAELEKRFTEEIPTVEQIQDTIERVLMRAGLFDVAKKFILYREKRRGVRIAKAAIVGVKDELKLSVNALRVLERRYLLKDENGLIRETPAEMFRRVAHDIAQAEANYGSDPAHYEERFYRLLSSLDFLPNSPTLMNAGTPLQQLAACFVLPVEDSMAGIFETLKNTALIHQTGGGTGFSFSRLRPKDDVVHSTGGIASGPVSFMKVFDVATEVIKQGGRRRGANMGILRVDHPDIFEFVTAKRREGVLSNFNLSVAVTDEFMEAVKRDDRFPLINPRTKQKSLEVSARELFHIIATSAWEGGDPGLVFIDRINEANPIPELGEIEATNPCGEQPLLPYEACNLGSINLSHFYQDGGIDFDRLRETVTLAIRFLDDVIDRSRFPLDRITRMVRGNRKIGLGVMGFADLLLKLKIPYDSEEALKVAEEVISFISGVAHDASRKLAQERGPFPNFDRSIFKKRGEPPLRNATLLTIAPTGTISIIAGCSQGIEPIYALVYTRTAFGDTELLEINPIFAERLRQLGLYSDRLISRVARAGGIRDLTDLPEELRRVFVSALEIGPEFHLKIQAAFQAHVDNAVSKTINLPPSATIAEVERIFMLAYELKLKGITIYRQGSRPGQILKTGDELCPECF